MIFVFFLVPATFRDKANPNFTIKRMYDSAREEFEQLERLREVCFVLECLVKIGGHLIFHSVPSETEISGM